MDKFGKALLEKAIELQYPTNTRYGQYVHERYGSQGNVFSGCSWLEIKALKVAQKVKRLPDVYIQYLKFMGKKSGDLYIGLENDFNSILTLKGSAKVAIKAYESFTLPPDAFVFRSQYEHSFWYFLTDNEDEDPNVYLWSEADEDGEPNYGSAVQVSDSLSYFLTLFIAERVDKEVQELFLAQYIDKS